MTDVPDGSVPNVAPDAPDVPAADAAPEVVGPAGAPATTDTTVAPDGPPTDVADVGVTIDQAEQRLADGLLPPSASPMDVQRASLATAATTENFQGKVDPINGAVSIQKKGWVGPEALTFLKEHAEELIALIRGFVGQKSDEDEPPSA